MADLVIEHLETPLRQPEGASVDIRVVASDRGNDSLYQTVTFLLQQQQQQSSRQFNYSLSICNVESEIFPDLKRFERMEIPISTLGGKRKFGKNPAENLNFSIEKENEDYWKCLGIQKKSRYILLVEDDVIVIPEFSKLLGLMTEKLDSNENVDYVKLYHPNYLRKSPFFVWIAIISLVTSYFLCCFIPRKFPILLFLILFIATFWDLKSYGSQFPSEIRYHLTGSAYWSIPESCCTQAVIFRTSSVPKMLEVFERSVAYSGHAKDHILDDSPFTGRQSDINYVVHIGSYSSVRQKVVTLTDLREI